MVPHFLKCFSAHIKHLGMGPGALLPGPYLIVTRSKEVRKPGAINESAKPVNPGQTYAQAHACHKDHHAGTSVASCAMERSLSGFCWQ